MRKREKEKQEQIKDQKIQKELSKWIYKLEDSCRHIYPRMIEELYKDKPQEEWKILEDLEEVPGSNRDHLKKLLQKFKQED